MLGSWLLALGCWLLAVSCEPSADTPEASKGEATCKNPCNPCNPCETEYPLRMAVCCPLSVVSCLQHSCLRQRVVYRKMIPPTQQHVSRVKLRGAEEASLGPLGDAGEGPQAATLQEVYEAQVAVYVRCGVGRGNDVLHPHEPKEQDHRSSWCHVLHMDDVGAHHADGTTQMTIEEEDALVAPYPNAFGREEEYLSPRPAVASHHIGGMLIVARHRHLMPTLHEGLHGVERLYLGTTCEEAGDADKSFHSLTKCFFIK